MCKPYVVELLVPRRPRRGSGKTQLQPESTIAAPNSDIPGAWSIPCLCGVYGGIALVDQEISNQSYYSSYDRGLSPRGYGGDTHVRPNPRPQLPSEKPRVYL